MDWVTILALVLFAGVVAFLAWLGINPRQNEASKEARSVDVETLPKESQTTVEAKADKKKAA
jgi:HAMP domain-containing protein